MYCFKVIRRNRALRAFLIFTGMSGLCETALLPALPMATIQRQPAAAKPTAVQLPATQPVTVKAGTPQPTTNRPVVARPVGLNPRVVYSKPMVSVQLKSSFFPSYKVMLFLGGAGIVAGWLGYKCCGWTYGLPSLMSMINGSSAAGSGSEVGSNSQPQQPSGLFGDSQPGASNLQQPVNNLSQQFTQPNNFPQQSVYNFIPQNQRLPQPFVINQNPVQQNPIDVSRVQRHNDLTSSFFIKPKQKGRRKSSSPLSQSVFVGTTTNNVQANNDLSQSVFGGTPTTNNAQTIQSNPNLTTTNVGAEEVFDRDLSASYNGAEVIETPVEQKKRFMPGTKISPNLKDKILHISHVLAHTPKTK